MTKQLNKFIRDTIVAGFMVTLLIACKKDDDPQVSKVDEVRQMLTSGTWSLQSLQVDGVATDLYSGLSLTFSNTGFTSSNGEPVWPTSGTWNFDDETAQSFTRSDDITVAINSITNSSVQLTLSWNRTTLGPGRTESIKGVHAFLFGK